MVELFNRGAGSLQAGLEIDGEDAEMDAAAATTLYRFAQEGLREIAEMLVITEGTVKNHVSNLIARLNVRDRTQAIL